MSTSRPELEFKVVPVRAQYLRSSPGPGQCQAFSLSYQRNYEDVVQASSILAGREGP